MANQAPMDTVAGPDNPPLRHGDEVHFVANSPAPVPEVSGAGFLTPPGPSDAVQALFDGDAEDPGYVMNATRLWSHQPATMSGLFDLMRQTLSGVGLSLRDRGILVSAFAAQFGDSYCSIAWGSKLAAQSDAETAAAVLTGDDSPLDQRERALARWARAIARDPNATSAQDVQELRVAGFDESQIFGITVFVALRQAFSTVNDALGATPDPQFRQTAPAAVLAAVRFGRHIGDMPV